MSYSLDNLPYGIASSTEHPNPQVVTRYHDNIIYLAVLHDHGYFKQVTGLPGGIFAHSVLNEFAGLPKVLHRQLRVCIQEVLQNETTEKPLPASAKVLMSGCTLHMPLHISNFTDFSCSREHNLRAAKILLGATSLPPAFYSYPLGYTGRASSIVLSGTPVQRPLGMFQQGSEVIFGPEQRLDFELELACVVGQPVGMGAGCSVEKASDHIFGFALLNDWSARDIQGLEMRPLGPLNGKSFQTTISPWIITAEALEACQVDAVPLETSPAPYLQRQKRTLPSITLQAEIISSKAYGNDSGNELNNKTVVSTSRVESLYWTFEDLITQQTINGCSLKSGDILATGTISGSRDDERGCLIEATMGGKTPLVMPDGTTRSYLEDGDIVRFTGYATVPSSNNIIDFGECTGQIMPARQLSI